jgi:hypothetical protein
MCHDVFMGKRSSRMAKRGAFENGLKAAEDAIGLLGKKPDVAKKPDMPKEKEEKKEDDAGVGKPGHN